MSLETEFLHFNARNDLPNYDELISSESVISPKLLVSILTDALTYLTTTPGLHLSTRQLFSGSWIGWWIAYLDALPPTARGDLIPSQKIKKSLPRIQEALDLEHRKGRTSGLLLMGGGEGTEAHRYAQDWVARYVDLPVLLLEHPGYVDQKDRGGRFLPLSIGLSMWAHYQNTRYIGLVPKNTEGTPANIFYQAVHNQTGAQFHFASENDPNCWSKIERGESAEFCLIPTLDVPSTTTRTRKLMDGVETDDLDISDLL